MIAARLRHAMAYNGIEADQVKTDTHLWQLWHWIHAETSYDDSHPRFRSHARQFTYEPGFQLYPDGTNDASMTTALRWAISQIHPDNE